MVNEKSSSIITIMNQLTVIEANPDNKVQKKKKKKVLITPSSIELRKEK